MATSQRNNNNIDDIETDGEIAVGTRGDLVYDEYFREYGIILKRFPKYLLIHWTSRGFSSVVAFGVPFLINLSEKSKQGK